MLYINKSILLGSILILFVNIADCMHPAMTIQNKNFINHDTQVFEYIIEMILKEKNTFQFRGGDEVIVDPRAFIPDSNLDIGIKLIEDEKLVKRRIEILNEHQLVQVNFDDYQKCKFSPEMQPPETGESFNVSNTCKKWIGKVAVIISLSKQVKDGEKSREVQLLAKSNYSIERYRYSLVKNKDHWQITGKDTLDVIAY